MTNHSNFAIAAGRLTADPQVFENKDGSRKVYVKLAIPRNYKNKDNSVTTDFPQFEAFVAANQKGNGPFDYMNKGDKISIEYELRTNEFEKNGEKIYTQNAFVRSVQLMETKTTTDKRKAERAVKEASENTSFSTEAAEDIA